MTTGDHLFSEVIIIEDTDAAATRMSDGGRGRRFGRTDHGLRMAPSASCAFARQHPEHDAWTGVRVNMGKNQEIYGAELHVIHRVMFTLFQELYPAARRLLTSQTPRQPCREMTSDAPGPG